MHAHTRVRLADGGSVIQRSPTMIQFGLDATRTGIIETQAAAQLSKVLAECTAPRQLRHVHRLMARYVDADAARSLVNDLVSYRILVPEAPKQILMLGTSPLATSIAEILGQTGMLVRTPPRQDQEAEFLAKCNVQVPLIIVDALSRALSVSQLSRHRPGPTLPVAVIDSRVLVGPLRLRVNDPCTACASLHHLDRDAGWAAAVRQLPAGPNRPDPVVVAVGAAVAATVSRRLAAIPDPPGVSAPVLEPGHALVVDPYGPVLVKDEAMAVHPRCGVCFG